MIKGINDLLALLVTVLVFPVLWVLDGCGVISLPGEVLGATIAAFTLIVQYYFRKKAGDA
jgi:hypothetical protein